MPIFQKKDDAFVVAKAPTWDEDSVRLLVVLDRAGVFDK